jgi:hypothetical protein
MLKVAAAGYFREHEGLNGITPEEASGIKEDNNKVDNCDSECQ